MGRKGAPEGAKQLVFSIKMKVKLKEMGSVEPKISNGTTILFKIGTTYLYLAAFKNFRLLITIFGPIFMA